MKLLARKPSTSAPELGPDALYAGRFDVPVRDERFGLRSGQHRQDQWVHNGSWFGPGGVKLGWGDLGTGDVLSLAHELREGEFVLACSESAFWDHVTQFGPIGALCQTSPRERAPGARFLAQKARFCVLPGEVWDLNLIERGHRVGAVVRVEDDVPVVAQSRKALEQLLRQSGARK